MSTALLDPTSTAALARLSQGLAAVRVVSGRTATSILVQKGGQLLYGNRESQYGAAFHGLVDLFQFQMPNDTAIWSGAKARSFRLGRRTFTTTGVGAGISPTAMKRAVAMMGGNKSILVSSNPFTGSVAFVRIGARGRRVRFRRGRLSVTTAAAGGVVAPRADERRVNLRAVATIMELGLRQGGRRFLSSSWLFKRWRNFAKPGNVPAGTPGLSSGPNIPSRQFGGSGWRLENVNPRSTLTPLGEAQLTGEADAGNATLRITSRVPGVLAIGTSRGLFARAIASVTLDLEAYVARKLKTAADALVTPPR